MRSGPLTVLVAEDHPLNRDIARLLLERLGHRVLAVGDGESAIAAVAAAHFDLVLMDLQMPVMDGFEAARAIRRLPSDAAAVPILALTASSRREDLDNCIAAGMNGHISKPLDGDRLGSALDRMAAGCEWTDAVGATPAADELVDRNWVEEMRANMRPHAFAGAIAACRKSIGHSLAELREAARESRYDELRRVAHRMKGTAALYGLVALQAGALAIEEASRAAEDAGLDRLLGEVNRIARDSLAVLEETLRRSD